MFTRAFVCTWATAIACRSWYNEIYEAPQTEAGTAQGRGFHARPDGVREDKRRRGHPHHGRYGRGIPGIRSQGPLSRRTPPDHQQEVCKRPVATATTP